MNAELQADWEKYGANAFSYEVLEEKATEKVNDTIWEAKRMLGTWLDELQPYGGRGYNKEP